MRRKFKNFFYIGSKFKKEFKKQIRYLIIITLGFTIAFTWRQTIFDLSQSFIKSITHIENLESLSILTSLFITFFGILLIYLSAHFLKNNDY